MKKKIGWKLIIPIILLLAVVWYQFVYVATRDEIASLDNQRMEVEADLSIEQVRNAKMNSMLKELETLKNTEAVTEIPDYDNIQNVMNSLNMILAQADDYSLVFDTPSYDGQTSLYRRNVSMTFKTSNLDSADQIITQIYESPYRCVIGSINMVASDSTGNNNGKISLEEDGNQVYMQLTYYELAPEK